MNTLRLLSNHFSKGACTSVNVKSISVSGFKNVRHNSLDLGKVTALLSTNGYGKSNLLQAIDFGFDFILANNKEKSQLMASSKCMPRLRNLHDKEYSLSFVFSAQHQLKECSVEYGYSFSWATKEEAAKVTSEYLRIKIDEKSQKYKSYIDRDDKRALYKKSVTGRCANVIKIDDSGLVINKLLSNDDLFYHDIVSEINDFYFYIVKNLDAEPSFAPNPIIWKYAGEKALSHIESIPRTIFKLKAEMNDQYELLINSFLQLFPNFESVNVESIEIDGLKKGNIKLNENEDTEDTEDGIEPPFDIDNSIYLMNVKDKNLTKPINFENLSDGVKRVFLTLTFAVMADVNGVSILAIEEPENCIHPKLLQDYLDVLSQLVENCKIIVSSHSPYLLQYLNPRNIYVGVPNQDGYATFKPIMAAKINALIRDAKEDNESIGGYLFNLISQSDDDPELLESYLGG